MVNIGDQTPPSVHFDLGHWQNTLVLSLDTDRVKVRPNYLMVLLGFLQATQTKHG